MATQVTNYKCPSCTAPLKYVAWKDRMECEYCNRLYTVEEIEARYGIPEQAAAHTDTEDLWGEGAEQMRAYSCPSCGAKLICEATTAATGCPYCGNHAIIPSQFAGVKRPDYVIPFKLTKEDAVAALKRNCKHRLLIPSEFAKKQCLKAIKGVYVPFWLFDACVNVTMTFDAQNTRSTRIGREEEVVEQHYDVRRAGYVEFVRVPADGSCSMPDNFMDAIEPYDYSGLKPFAMAYLPGYLADRYDVDADVAYRRASRRMKNTAKDAVRSTVSGYDEVETEFQDIFLSRRRTDYALLPVWLLRAEYQGREYMFAVNGQTGKTVGDFPVSEKKLRAAVAALTGAFAVGFATALTALMAWFL